MHDYWLEFSKVAVAHALAVASPGPDFAVVLKQSLSAGRRAALLTSIGIGTAILLHITYSLLGLGLLIRGSEAWFTALKYAGAVYLGWLGVQGIRAKRRGDDSQRLDAPASRSGSGNAFALGFFTNALNPKATLFFISLFVLAVNPGTPKMVQAAYGLWMVAATMGWFALVSVVFTRPHARLIFVRHGHWIDRALGLVFFAFAASLLVATKT